MTTIEPPVTSADMRRANLSAAVQHEVARGARIEMQSDFNAVIIRGKYTNHVLHLLLTIVTGVWVLCG